MNRKKEFKSFIIKTTTDISVRVLLKKIYNKITSAIINVVLLVWILGHNIKIKIENLIDSAVCVP